MKPQYIHFGSPDSTGLGRTVKRFGGKGGVEKPGGFFNICGAPVPGASVEKPHRFFNNNAPVNERSDIEQPPPRYPLDSASAILTNA